MSLLAAGPFIATLLVILLGFSTNKRDISIGGAVVLAGLMGTHAIAGDMEGDFRLISTGAIWCAVALMLIMHFLVASLFFVLSGVCYHVAAAASLPIGAWDAVPVAADGLGYAGLAMIGGKAIGELVGSALMVRVAGLGLAGVRLRSGRSGH